MRRVIMRLNQIDGLPIFHAPPWVWVDIFWVAVICWMALPIWLIGAGVVWLTRSWGDFGWASLQEGAQIVYDDTRHSVMSQIARARVSSDDNPLVFVANTIIHRCPNLEGCVNGATKYDHITMDGRDRLWANSELKNIGLMFQPPSYYAVRIKRKDLKEVIAYFQRQEAGGVSRCQKRPNCSGLK